MTKSNTAMKNAVERATERQARETKDKQASQGMTPSENHEQITKAHNASVQEHHTEGELAGTAPETTEVAKAVAHTIHFDETGNVTPDSFKETLELMSTEFAEVQQEQVDRTFFSTFTDMFRVATLLVTEFGVLPEFTELGRAWQAVQAPEKFAFDKSVLAPSQAAETEGVLQPMTWQEIKARQDAGLKPLSGPQWTFYIETCERVLHGISYLHTMRELGYMSQHTKEDIWQTASENEAKRQNNYKLQQEAEAHRKAADSKGALDEATKTGGALDL